VVTIFISGAGTGVGKTQVAAALARWAAKRGRTVQIIKPVQSGVARGEPSDADLAAKMAELPPDCAHTLRSYRAALAPLAAAKMERKTLEIKKIINEMKALPEANLRLVEGAGGIAVPLKTNGWDWADFASAIRPSAVVLVVADELGAINQARLACHYTRAKIGKKIPCGIMLNSVAKPPRAVAASTRAALLACGVPIWGELRANSLNAKLHFQFCD
jgi:dethiobiotin synthetase